MKKYRNYKFLLIINFILLLFIVLLTESIFRIVGIPYKVKYIPNESSFARFDHELGWSYVPDKSAENKTGDISVPVYLETNGIRVPQAEFEFDYSKSSILFIGGSFTMGHGLPYEESFVGKIDASKEVSYQIVNLGVQAYGSDQALLALKKYLPKFNTRVVVYTFIEDHIYRNSYNDRRLLVPSARFLGTKPQFALNKDNELYQSQKPMLYTEYINSFLFDFLKKSTGMALGNFPPFREDVTKAIIKEMKRYSNDNGAQFVVLDWRWNQNDYELSFGDADIDIIDTMKNVPDDWSEMKLFEGVHPNGESSDHAARLLIDFFDENRLIGKRQGDRV